MASKGDTVSAKKAIPIELMVLEKHEQELIDLMQASIDRVQLSLFTKGLLAKTNIDEEHELLTREKRMKKVLEYILRLMEKESKEKEGQIFEKFLDSLKDEPAWDFLRDKLCKLMFQCYSQIEYIYTIIYQL